MTGYECKQVLARNGTICGTLIVSPSPKWVKYIDKCGLDFVFFDTEHVALDILTLSGMCMLYAAKGLAPVVRISSPDPYIASQVLDAGAHGILAPYIESAEQVRRLVGAVHYKPLKGRLLDEALSGKFPSSEVEVELKKNNKNHLLLVNIESVPGMEALDEILAVPGLDGVVVGPNDLSFSLGIPNDYNNEIFEDAVVSILKRTRQKGLAAGVHAMGHIDRQISWAEKTGMNLLFHSGDMHVFIEGMRKDVLCYRQSLGLDHEDAGSVNIVI